MIKFSHEVLREIAQLFMRVLKNASFLAGYSLSKIEQFGESWQEIIHSFMDGYKHRPALV